MKDKMVNDLFYMAVFTFKVGDIWYEASASTQVVGVKWALKVTTVGDLQVLAECSVTKQAQSVANITAFTAHEILSDFMKALL